MPSGQSNDPRILLPFLETPGAYVSGEKLARMAGVSRVSVWNRMNKLEEDGFRFEAVRNRGYRMVAEPATFHPLLMEAYARLKDLELPLSVHNSIDSTSSEIERLLISGKVPPFAVVASEQTRGRGRMGRPWESQPAGNAYLSLAFRPNLQLDRMQCFTLWMGVNLVHLLRHLTGLPLQIKWPNDVLCKGRKLAGMLTEARIDNDHLKDLIFGLGVNINAGHFEGDLGRKATSIYLEDGRIQSVHRYAAEILATLLKAYRQIETENISESLKKQWDELDCLRDQPVSLDNGFQNLTGIARGIDEQGALLLEEDSGETTRVLAGDVSLSRSYPQ